MIKYTFSKHVKFRKEKDDILICDCKNLKDFKLKLEFDKFLKKVSSGISENELLDNLEILLFQDFHSSKLLAELTVRTISTEEYPPADAFLEKQLYQHLPNGKRPRSYDFLLDKLNKNPELFLGLYLDSELIGVVQGFPRDDYLLLSEIAVDIRFRDRGFGSLLIKSFENTARSLGYNKIKLGAQDYAVNLYLKNQYTPSLFIQIKEYQKDSVIDTLPKQDIIDISSYDSIIGIELRVDAIDIEYLHDIEKRFQPISIQYLFTKCL
ncbi:MAG: GNAT family N-acetyltransferase [Candidatus Woesearchaeota archaeon]